MSFYSDPLDGSSYPLETPRWCSDAGNPLWIGPGGGIAPAQIDTSVRSLWRYKAAFPIRIANPISMGEGVTPLIQREWAAGKRIARVGFKLEWFAPTGSFKDRGTSVMLSYLRDRGVSRVLEDSSGNGGSSVAGYAAAGGLAAKVFAPKTTSPAKIAQVLAYGADVELVPGPRQASQDAAISQATGSSFYASHNWQAFFLQGTKTLAYEIWEDLGFSAPDNVILPVGAGSALLGCYLGFAELLNAGQIDAMPRLFAAQPWNCSPIDAAFQSLTLADRGGTTGASRQRRSQAPLEQAGHRPILPTIAEGTSIAVPLRMAKILEVLRETRGGTAAVTEDQIVAALARLCHTGLFVEPTSATAAAALTILLEQGTVRADETTVVMLSGTGLKAAQAVADAIA